MALQYIVVQCNMALQYIVVQCNMDLQYIVVQCNKALSCIATQPPAATPAAKETPAERVKRMMAAQLRQQAAKDSITAAQRKLMEEKERAARMAHERTLR